MNIKLDHINLTVSNLENSLNWYHRIFGFELVESGKTPNGIKWAIVAFNDSMICMSEFPDKILADRGGARTVHQINHFGIRVSDQDKWKKIVEENSLRVHYGGEVQYPHSSSWYIHDPSGHEIEVSYTAEDRMPFPGRGAS